MKEKKRGKEETLYKESKRRRKSRQNEREKHRQSRGLKSTEKLKEK